VDAVLDLRTVDHIGSFHRRSVDAVLDLPLLRTEPADEEQYNADGEVGEDDAEPDVCVERVHEREDATRPCGGSIRTKRNSVDGLRTRTSTVVV